MEALLRVIIKIIIVNLVVNSIMFIGRKIGQAIRDRQSLPNLKAAPKKIKSK